jgi:endoglycosylceramidase
MHQDAYSRFTPETAPINAPPAIGPSRESSAHADGAPLWAVVTDGVPAEAVAGTPEFNGFVQAAFTSFWLNRTAPGTQAAQGAAPGPGLQDHYIGAMAALARRFKDDSTVVGYEIMNEPLPGFIPPVAFSTTELYPFYARVITTLTGVGVTKQSFFFEPMALRNLEDAPDQLPLPFTTYPNLVYSPHTYTHVFTIDTRLPGHVPYPLSYDQAYQVADAEARSMGAALLPTEYGNSASQDSTILASETAAQDRAIAGSAIYQWKGVCRSGAALRECSDTWSVYAGDPATPPAQNLGLIPTRVKYLSRIYPRATAGTLTSFAYHPDTQTFTMTATADRPATAPTVLFIPAGAGGKVTVAGAAHLTSITVEPDGTRLAEIMPTGHGAYGVTVA